MSVLLQGEITNNVVELNLQAAATNIGTSTVLYDSTNNGEIINQIQGDIPNYSFGSSPYYFDSTLKGIVIGTSCTQIGSYSFMYSGLSGSLAIPNSVTTIAISAFDGCSSLNGSFIIPNSVTSIGDTAFFFTSFTAAYINCPASSWVGINALNSTISLTNIYVHADYVAGYDAAWKTAQATSATVSTWTNYPAPAP